MTTPTGSDPRVHRLVALAGGCAAGAYLGLQPRCPHSRWLTAIGVGAALMLSTRFLARPAGLRLVVAGWLTVGLLLGMVSAARHVGRLADTPLRGLATAHTAVDAEVRLLRDPTAVTTSGGEAMWLVDATAMWVGQQPGRRQVIERPILIFGFSRRWNGLLPGQRVQLSGRLAPPGTGDTVSAVLDARSPPSLVGRPPWWERAAADVRGSLAAACAGLPPSTRALVPGLVLGVVTPMPGGLKEQFRVTGLSHLVAVSGENLAILFAAVVWLVRWIGLPRWARVAAMALTVVGFVVIARPSPSVLRAAVMGGIAVVALVTGRRRRPLPALASAAAVLLLVDPFLVADLGFQLSVSATAGIVVLAPPIARWAGRRLPRRLALLLAVPLAAQLACTPLLVGSFGELTPYAVPANLAAGLAVPAATLAGVVTAVIAVVAVPLSPFAARLAALPAAWIVGCARWFAGLPGAAAQVPGWTGPAAVGVVVIGWLGARLARTVRRSGACDP